VQWRRIFAQVRQENERTFVANARAQGFVDGVTTPIHGPQGCVAIMMFAAGQNITLDHEDEEALSHIAMALHQRVRRLAAGALVALPEPARLTSREIECLQWVLEGKTNWEIGMVTGVTPRTVQFHLSNAARKLGVVNRVQAAVGALIRGDLTIKGLYQHIEHQPQRAHTMDVTTPHNAQTLDMENSRPSKFSEARLDRFGAMR
jgi:DNA-binding CsgD family transcriptional regulator